MQGTAGLADVFALERRDDDTWVGRTDGVRLPQLFGGQLVGQSLIAAGASVEGKDVHSVHTTFLRGGAPGVPVTFRVERLRDGRQISTREVSAWQGERLLCRSIVSCAVPADGITHSRPAPTTPGPDECPDIRDVAAADGGLGEFWEDFAAIEVRLAPDVPGVVPHSASPANGVWMRSVEPLSDDPVVHRAALAYASDLMLMSTAVTPHGHTSGHERSLANTWNAVSLDHAMWFRGLPRADEWMLFEHTTPMAGAGRALIEAAVFDARGTSICHVAQEALVKPLNPSEDS
ncbi:thioesterase family protein [Aeromicrobium fastidiosum]|uniref:acyl-CoA thioesterase n=1 Tax=Aeromicrobium fastidiosum TaxID=52699 RepID=UPI00202387B7|nr:acyl-CoA thioesterase domain-containing protein [Aeromicrobium fastidiosum]MCL8250062.1 thioesterase family protein [Aeromicrobium fastidiosum]